MKPSKTESFTLPAHVHIELKGKGITYNDNNRPLKFRPFADKLKGVKIG